MAPRVLFGTRLEETKFDITTVDDGPPSRHGVCAEERGGGGGGGGGFFLACGDSGEDWTNHSTSTVQKEKKKKEVEISSLTPLPLFGPGAVCSGSAS